MNRPKIYAVDFDGTLCENRWPEIGEPNVPLIAFLKNEQAKGALVVLWTMREGRRLHEAREWLSNEFAFVPDAVNDNVRVIKERFGNNPRKVYADVYIDDHNARHNAQLVPVTIELPFKGEKKMAKKDYTKEEWLAEGERLFGKDYAKWRFKCPRCGNIATGQEFKDAKAEPNTMYQECIGRHVKGKGCDWAAYGLFNICTVHVDGQPVFEFAPLECEE